MRKKIFLWLFIFLVLVIGVSAINRSAVWQCWNFEENTGTTTWDNVSHFAGTFTNTPAWDTGKVGYSLDFDVNDRVEVPAAAGHTGSNDRCVQFWFMNDADQEQAFYTSGATSNDAHFGIKYNTASKKPFIDFWGTNTLGNTSFVIPSINTWYLYTASYQANGTTLIYINDTLYFAGNYPNRNTGAGTVYFGYQGGTGSTLNAHLDQIIVWNRTCDAEMINYVYNSYSGVACSDVLPDLIPPVNSTWNATSGNVHTGFVTTGWSNGSAIPISSDLLSFTVVTDENTNMSCRLDVEQNYTEMVNADPSYKAATTETTSHAFTVPETISEGFHCLYCDFVDQVGNGKPSGESASGCLNLSYNAFPLCSIDNLVDFEKLFDFRAINWTITDNNNYVINISAVNISGQGYEIFTGLSSDFNGYSFNFSLLGLGIHNVSVYGLENDSYERLSCLDSVIVNVTDVVYPDLGVYIISPTNDSIVSSLSEDFSFNVNNSADCYLYLNGISAGNLTTIGGNDSFLSVSLINNTNYTWSVLCSQSLFNNGNSSEWIFQVYYDAPPGFILSPGTCPNTWFAWVLLYFMIILGLFIGFMRPLWWGVNGVFSMLILVYSGTIIGACEPVFMVLLVGIGIFAVIIDLSGK